ASGTTSTTPGAPCRRPRRWRGPTAGRTGRPSAWSRSPTRTAGRSRGGSTSAAPSSSTASRPRLRRRAATAGFAWMGAATRPVLALGSPQPGANGPLAKLLVGAYDYGSGLDPASFSVKADFPVNGREPGEELAPLFRPASSGVWALPLDPTITQLRRGRLE